ncbi:MAG: restriction endonuclease subunit S, partial [Parcubacteria group bacterium]|nr:restriction endonuclease subunit S [Parcubacteria group bacterium]
KMLIEISLYAVVSLPAGVFNPYSGVKTSILFLNKNLAKKTDKILFVKVNNDGFGLGAQRREVKENDLQMALEIINKYKSSINEGKEIGFDLNEKKIAHIVKKEKIAEGGDYNLGGDRYKEAVVYNGKWNFVELGKICKVQKGDSIKKKNTKLGKIPVVAGGQQPAYYHNKFNREGNIITVSASGAYAGFVNYFKEPIFASDCSTIRSLDEKVILTRFMYDVLKGKQQNIYSFQRGVAQPHVYPKDLISFKVPLPPLEIQEQIVAELDNYQKIINGARQVVENYKPTFKIDPEWEMIEVGDVCEFNPKKSEVRNLADDLEVSFVPMADLNEHKMLFSTKQTKNKAEVYQGYTYFKENDVLLARVTPCFENGKSGIARNLKNGIGFGSSEYFVYRPKKNILPEWIYYFISSLNFIESGKNHMTGTGGLQRLTKEYATRYKIPFPPLKVQQQIVARIENEQKAIDSNKELITIFENKIKDKIAEVWGE